MLVINELNKLESKIINILDDSGNCIAREMKNYLCAKSKKLRSAFVFLFAKSLGKEISSQVYDLACAVELVHNATLIHDDIIDEAKTRRGRISLNFEIGNTLSVLAGDTLLALALNQLSLCGNINIITIFSECIYNLCKGEINQNSTLNTVPTMIEYISKSKNKTAELFKAPILSLAYLCNIQNKLELLEFAYNFGIAFQIKDDLINIINNDNTKPALSDIHNGIYTAPVIFLNEDNPISKLSKSQIIEQAQNEKYITKTVELIKTYAQKAISAIDFIPNNEYKREIIQITENLYKVNVNE